MALEKILQVDYSRYKGGKTMKELKVKITFLEELLGTANSEKDIHREFIASKSPDALPKTM